MSVLDIPSFFREKIPDIIALKCKKYEQQYKYQFWDLPKFAPKGGSDG